MTIDLEAHINKFFSNIHVNWDTVRSLAIQDESGNKNFGNKGAVLVEEAFLLYSLVRLTKPKYVLDAGTYIGIAAMFMAEGLRDNGFGQIVSVEHNNDAYSISRRLFGQLSYLEIEQHHIEIEDFVPRNRIDFLFLDTETAERVDQFNYLKKYFSDVCWVVFHDSEACEGIETIPYPYLNFKTVRQIRVYEVRQDGKDRSCNTDQSA